MKANPLSNDSAERLTIESELFGSLSVHSDQAFEFTDGLYGFPAARKFVLIPAGPEGFYWLQSLDHGPLVFLLGDPFVLVSEYSVELGESEVGPISADDPSDLAVLAIVTLPKESDGRPTLNLQGPITLNVRRRLGRQVVVSDSVYGIRWPLDFRITRLAS